MEQHKDDIPPMGREFVRVVRHRDQSADLIFRDHHPDRDPKEITMTEAGFQMYKESLKCGDWSEYNCREAERADEALKRAAKLKVG